MKGVIFTELFEMVRARFGLRVLDDAIGQTNSETDGAYTAVGTYPDQELFDFVAALSRHTNLETSVLLREFGTHLFGRLASLYPAQIDTYSDCFGLLESLENVIHPNVQKLYPDAVLPRFSIVRPREDLAEVRYESPRGLSDLALGLIEGCADWFDEDMLVQRISLSSDGTSAIFHILRQN